MSDPDPAHLRAAADHLAAAADAAGGDAAERLDGLANQCASLAERSRGPDHGRLARILTAIDEVGGGVDDAAAEELEDARAELLTYREAVEGV